jgi:hypothetical protein
MKVEVTLWDEFGEKAQAQDESVVDVGDLYESQVVEDWEKASQKIHEVMKNWIIFPGYHISFTIPQS